MSEAVDRAQQISTDIGMPYVTEHEVVIVGGGAGGLELAVRLARGLGRNRVTLVDRSLYHIWKPTLHEVAAGAIDPHSEGLSYPLLARRYHFQFVFGEVSGVDANAKTLTVAKAGEGGPFVIPERTLRFQRLVLAVGSGTNLFNTPGAESAHLLERVEDAERFRAHFLAAFIRASRNGTPLRVVIVGGGSTGVELAAQLVDANRELCSYLVSAPPKFEVTIVEGAPHILGPLGESIAQQAVAMLASKGVTVLTGVKVEAISSDHVDTSDGPIPADLVVWAAGVKAAAANGGFGLKVNRLNQFEVDSRLRTSVDGIYALGDCAACPWTEGKVVPPRAQAAHQQASYLARVIRADLSGWQAPAEGYEYRDFGSLVSIGGGKAVGSLSSLWKPNSLFVAGRFAKLMYLSLRFSHQLAVLGLVRAIFLNIGSLAQRPVSGRVKLH